MAAETVNAYYSAELNEMVFPAGILKRPFYDAKFPEWVMLCWNTHIWHGPKSIWTWI